MSRRESTASNTASSKAKAEKQKQIDTMITKVHKDSSMEEIIKTLNDFSQQIKQLASKEHIEKCMKKMVSEDSIKKLINEMKKELASEIKAEMDKMYENIKKIEAKMEDYELNITELKNQNSDIDSRLDKAEADNDKLRKSNEELKSLVQEREIQLRHHDAFIDDLEQYTRKNSIRIYGINDPNRHESPVETCALVIKTIGEKLNIALQQRDIDIAHRLGRFRTDGNRPIICKFVHRLTKERVISERKKLKGSSIVIREDLTTKRVKLLEKASQKEEVKNA